MSNLTTARADEPASRGRVRPEYPAAARPHGVELYSAGPGATAIAAARDALRAEPVSREALRDAVVRYAALAREQGANADDVTRALDAALGPALASFPVPLAADLGVHVAWWAAHGFHRVD